MKRGLTILFALLLAGISLFLFLIVFPDNGPLVPGLSLPAPAEAPTEPAEEPDDAAEQEPEPPEEEISHPMDGLLSGMTLEEVTAQLFWVRCPDGGEAEFVSANQPGGLLLFGRDFEGLTADEVRAKTAAMQQAASIPLLIGVDEEGGTVVRVSSNPNLRRWRFQSPQEVYAEGGLTYVREDTAEKDQLLHNLGINVNLAPVADVSTNPRDFIYDRAFGAGAEETAAYVAAVCGQMAADGMGSVLKHFPGYGGSADSHEGAVLDERSAQSFRDNDFVSFSAGIEAGAGAVLVCHNTVTAFDTARPASLSPAVHQVLREELDFSGVIVTDDMAMGAMTAWGDSGAAAVQAVLAGNDLLITSDFETQYQAVLTAVQQGTIEQSRIYDAARRVLEWKAALGLIVVEEEGEAILS